LYFEKAQPMDYISNGLDLVCYKISKINSSTESASLCCYFFL